VEFLLGLPIDLGLIYCTVLTDVCQTVLLGNLTWILVCLLLSTRYGSLINNKLDLFDMIKYSYNLCCTVCLVL